VDLQEPKTAVSARQLIVNAVGQVEHHWDGGEDLTDGRAVQHLLAERAVCEDGHVCEEKSSGDVLEMKGGIATSWRRVEIIADVSNVSFQRAQLMLPGDCRNSQSSRGKA
jgi:hypothetical protein